MNEKQNKKVAIGAVMPHSMTADLTTWWLKHCIELRY
jgi:hypothetical protein